MLRNLSEKLEAHFPLITSGYSKVRISSLEDAFLIMMMKVNQCSKEIRKREKAKE